MQPDGECCCGVFDMNLIRNGKHDPSCVQGKSTDSQGSNAGETGETEELAQRIKDNESEIALLRGAIEANEVSQQSVQARIDGTIEGQGTRNPQLLKMLKQFRLQVCSTNVTPPQDCYYHIDTVTSTELITG